MKKFSLTLANLLPTLVFLSLLCLIIFLVIDRYPLSLTFPYYDTDLLPYYSRFWATFAHFDGIHYLRLALRGYADWGSQAFFPLYPLLLHALSGLTHSPLLSGILISWFALLASYFALRRLFPSDRRLPWLVLAFPTAFFFAMLYTESLFFALSLWFFVWLREQKWLFAAILAGLASATRLPGAILAVSLFIALLHRPLSILQRLFLILLSLSGLLAYMGYLYLSSHDPLLFIHIQPVFGGGRSGGELILLPQVIYRYIRIFLSADPTTLLYQRAALEFAVFGWAIVVITRRFRQLARPVSAYLLLSLLLPTLSGSLSSLPRYALVLTPWLIPQSGWGRGIYSLLGISLGVSLLILYCRGIFVS